MSTVTPDSIRGKRGRPGRLGPRAAIARFRTRASVYRQIARSIATDALRLYRRDIVVVTLWGVFGVAGQFASILMIFAFARTLESGAPMKVGGLSLQLDQTLTSLLVVTAIVLATMLLSAFAQYTSRRRSIDAGCRYEAELVRRVTTWASRLPLEDPRTAMRLEPEQLRLLLNFDTRRCNRIMALLLAEFNEVLFFGAFAAAAFWLNPQLTLTIALGLGFYAVSLYRLNLQGAQASRTMEEQGRPAAAEKGELLRRLDSTTSVIPENDPHLDEMLLAGATKRRTDAYAKQFEVVPASQLLSNTFAALVLCGILTYYGASILVQGSGWSALLVYLLVVRLVLARLRKLASTLTTINRLYPSARRYFDAIRLADRARQPPTPPCLFDESRPWPAPRRGRVLVLGADPLGRRVATGLMALVHTEARVRPVLIRAPTVARRPAAMQALGLRTVEPDEVAPLGLVDELAQAVVGRGDEELTERVGFGLAVIAALRATPSVTCVDVDPLSDFAPEPRDWILRRLDGGLSFLYTRRGLDHGLVLDRETLCVIVDDGLPRAWARLDWLQANPEHIPRPRSAGTGYEDSLDHEIDIMLSG